MNFFPDIKLLKTSWTKFDCVQVIQITIQNDILSYYKGDKSIDAPILRSYLGVEDLGQELPSYWKKINDYPKQLPLFALMAAIFTHYENIEMFSKNFNRGNMQGVFVMKEGKHFTNLRSALVESGAAEKIYRRKIEIPYDLSTLFEIGDVGLLMKEVLLERLTRIGYEPEEAATNFFKLCKELDFISVFGLTESQFEEWIKGIGVSNSLYELDRNGISYAKYGKIKALKVRQWLKGWDEIPGFGNKNRRKPEGYFYQFNIPALLLKRIYDVHTRRAHVDRTDEQHSQRKHSEQRSNEIREFVHGGFPWSTITDEQRESEVYRNLRMPGWLPTSIIANILGKKSERRQRVLEDDSLIVINHIDENFAEIQLPERIWSDKWAPIVSPIEIIDGQHRIKAFDGIQELDGQFEFPVIAYFDLDFTWQAYLFYTINIKPKRINTSLAYDLMPLLRIQEWLEQDLNGPDIYKKLRAQELTELLWSTPSSPWYGRINMLGETGQSKTAPVSQNAFINSLSVSFVKRWDSKIGGLFGGEMNEGLQDVIQWDKETQAAYLILIWQSLNNAVLKSKAEWVNAINKKYDGRENQEKLANGFVDEHSFFTTDQGVRPILFVFNDMSFVASEKIGLSRFIGDVDYEKYQTSEIIDLIIERFKERKAIHEFLMEISKVIINDFDWRTPSAFDSNIPEQDQKRQFQNQFRGSSGYKELRLQLLRVLESSDAEIRDEDNVIRIADLAYEIRTKIGL